MIVSIALCGLLIAVSGDALSGDGFGNVKRLETEFTMTGMKNIFNRLPY